MPKKRSVAAVSRTVYINDNNKGTIYKCWDRYGKVDIVTNPDQVLQHPGVVVSDLQDMFESHYCYT